jgi:hypothetical protein
MTCCKQASKVENKTHKVNDKLHKTFYFYFVNKFKSTRGQLSSMYTITVTDSVLWQVILFCDDFFLFSEKNWQKLANLFWSRYKCVSFRKKYATFINKYIFKNTLTTMKFQYFVESNIFWWPQVVLLENFKRKYGVLGHNIKLCVG